MNRSTSLAWHRAACSDDGCPHCQGLAEMRAEDTEPEYDVEAAENSFERYQYGEPA